MELITCDNPRLGTMRNVLFLAKMRFPEIQRVYFVETSPCRELSERMAAVYEFLGEGVEIGQRRFSIPELYDKLPSLLAERLRHASVPDNLVVDMTNGTKLMSSILYASASLLKMKNLISVTVHKHAWDKMPTALVEGDYEVDLLQPIQQGREVGRAGLFEVLYYKDGFEASVRQVSVSKLHREYTRSHLKSDLLSAVDHYFAGRYSECVARLGVLAEALSEDLCHGVKGVAKGAITKAVPHNDAARAVDWLRVEFAEPLRAALAKDNDQRELSDYQRKLAPLATADTILAQLRPLRNFSAHPYADLPGAPEARVALHSMMYLMELIARSEVFS